MDKFKVVYLHGYGSSAQSNKVLELGKIFDVSAPNIPIKYDDAVELLTTYLTDLSKESNLILVGTSLGGYWAGVMSDKLGIPAVLINPSCSPKTTIDRYNNVELTQTELDKYIPLAPSNLTPKIVLLAKNDDVIDYQIAKTLFDPVADVRVFEDGGHRFNDINRIALVINDLNNSNFYLP